MAPAGFVHVRSDGLFDVFECRPREVVLACRNTRPTGSAELRVIGWSLESLFEPSWAGWGLVVDTRGAAGINDSRLEQDLTQWCNAAARYFRRYAILVRTPVGQQQAARHSQGLANAIATLDETQALAWAAAPPLPEDFLDPRRRT
jgi:hypothetical protein